MLGDIVCNTCRATFQVEIPELVRTPCPICSSTTREISAGITLGVKVGEYLGFKQKRGPGKPIFESMHKPDLHRKTGKMMELARVIDRETDRYKEIVTDPITGKVVHFCEEPLTEHKGHGSAKLGFHEQQDCD